MTDSIITGIDKLRSEGFTTEFYYENDQIIDEKTEKAYGVADCILLKHKRYEGMSDPSDSSILFAIKCNDGTKGYLSSAYGIYADEALFSFMTMIQKDS